MAAGVSSVLATSAVNDRSFTGEADKDDDEGDTLRDSSTSV